MKKSQKNEFRLEGCPEIENVKLHVMTIGGGIPAPILKDLNGGPDDPWPIECKGRLNIDQTEIGVVVEGGDEELTISFPIVVVEELIRFYREGIRNRIVDPAEPQ